MSLSIKKVKIKNKKKRFLNRVLFTRAITELASCDMIFFPSKFSFPPIMGAGLIVPFFHLVILPVFNVLDSYCGFTIGCHCFALCM